MTQNHPADRAPIEGERQLFDVSARYYPGPRGLQIIELTGETGVYSGRALRDFFNEIINDGCARIIMDLERLDFMDSTGLGAFVAALKGVRARDGFLDLACMQERVLKIFRITGHSKLYRIHKTLAEAVEAHSTYDGPYVSLEQIEHVIDSGDWIPVRLYLADAEGHERAEAALRTLIDEFGLEINYEFPPVYSSYWREFGARFKKRATSPATVDKRMTELASALQMHLAGEREPPGTDAQARAVAGFITALQGTSDAVIQIGAVLVLKHDGHILARNLSPFEVLCLERNPRNFRDPQAALDALQAVADQRGAEELLATSGAGVRGRHPTTRTVHLARAVSSGGGNSGNATLLVAECGRTRAPLLEANGTISCGTCRRIFARAQLAQ